MNTKKILLQLLPAIVIIILSSGSAYAQQNIGIGTSSPHPSAILHLADTLGKGIMIPNTDTNAVLAYVNSLTPNPGIANGLLIFQKSDQVFYYYDGPLSKWIPLSGITGPTGPKGLVGPTGPTGRIGSFSTIRYDSIPPSFQPLDKWGDYFLNTVTGRMHKVNLVSTNWTSVNSSPPRAIWRSPIRDGVSIHRSTTSQLLGPMPNTPTDLPYQVLPGLSVNVRVGPDSVGYAMIRAYGSTTKELPNNDYNYARFDIKVGSVFANVDQEVGIGPNGPPYNQFDITTWQIAYFTELNAGTHTIEVHGTQRYSRNTFENVILSSGPGSRLQANLDIFVIYRRND